MKSPSLLFPLVALTTLLSILPCHSFPLRGQLASGDHLEDLTLLGPSVRVHLNRIPIQHSSLLATSSSSTSNPSSQVDQESSTNPIVDLTASLPQWNDTRHSYSTLIKRDGSFLFPQLEAGTYLLTLAARTHNFHQYRIDVPLVGEMAGWGQHKKQKSVVARTWLPGQPASTALLSNPLPSPLIITAISKHEFFQEPEGFNPKALLANPMMLMAGAAMLLTYVMPKIMANLDPEAAAEIEANQKNMQKKMNALQSGDLGGFLNQNAGKNEGKRIGANTNGGGGGGGGGGKKRR